MSGVQITDETVDQIGTLPIDNISDFFQDFFNDDIEHGQIFDDCQRRWCAPCQRPQLICEESEHRRGKHFGCLCCGVLWPEYVQAFADGELTDDDLGEDFYNTWNH